MNYLKKQGKNHLNFFICSKKISVISLGFTKTEVSEGIMDGHYPTSGFWEKKFEKDKSKENIEEQPRQKKTRWKDEMSKLDIFRRSTQSTTWAVSKRWMARIEPIVFARMNYSKKRKYFLWFSDYNSKNVAWKLLFGGNNECLPVFLGLFVIQQKL